MDLSFQEKKRFVILWPGSQVTTVFGYGRILAFFLSHPVYYFFFRGASGFGLNIIMKFLKFFAVMSSSRTDDVTKSVCVCACVSICLFVVILFNS